MLIFGDHKCVGYLSPHTKIYNLTSLLEGFPRLNILPYNLRYSDEKEFDLAYALYLLENNIAFYDMMRIIYNLYLGIDVYVMVSTDQFSEILTESLMKFIQQRYGYNSNRVNEPSDLEYLINGDFSLLGIYNLDQDKDRFSYLIVEFIMSLENSKDFISEDGGIRDDFDIKSIL